MTGADLNGFNSVLPDIPRIYTAVAEWLACLLCILEVKRRITGWKLTAVSLTSLAIQSIFMKFTNGLENFLWIVCMIVAVAMMYAYILACCDMSAKDAVYYCVRAFVIAEFAASLQWQTYCYFTYNMFFAGWLFGIFWLVFVFCLVYLGIWLLYRKVSV